MSGYTLSQFEAEFPDDAACLEALFYKRYGDLEWCPNCGCKAKFYQLKNRRCFSCKDCRYQLYPTAGTVLHKSHMPLRKWFYVIYLFSISKNGIAAREIERLLGVTSVTALRMLRQIRASMTQDDVVLSGIVEADEAYIGGRRHRHYGRAGWYAKKVPVLGAVQRNGNARILVTDVASTKRVTDFLKSALEPEAIIVTDESHLYKETAKRHHRFSVNHARREYVRGKVYTNTIEGFWGNFKPYLVGTHRAVSKQYLQLYADERTWKYNHRQLPSLFQPLLDAVARSRIVVSQNAFGYSYI